MKHVSTQQKYCELNEAIKLLKVFDFSDNDLNKLHIDTMQVIELRAKFIQKESLFERNIAYDFKQFSTVKMQSKMNFSANI